MKNKTSAPKGSTLGVKDGQLAPCKKSPNCVSSQAEGSHYLAPIDYQNLDNAYPKMIEIINSMSNSKIVEKKKNYLRVEFRSGFFNFIDDVEFYFSEEEKKIHFRSAARSGYWDLGVNKKRIKEIKRQWR